MILDSEDQRKLLVLLIDNATIKCGDGGWDAVGGSTAESVFSGSRIA